MPDVAKASSVGEEKPDITAPDLPVISDQQSIEFMLAEYTRVSELSRTAVDSYHRRFDVWLAAFSAGLVSIITVFAYVTGPLQDILVLTIVAAVAVLGANVFGSLVSNTNARRQHQAALELIQTCFARRDPGVGRYLYGSFSRGDPRTAKIAAIRFKSVGLGLGLKAIVVIANSALLAILVVLAISRAPQASQIIPLAAGGVAFLISCALHFAYATGYYRINPV